MIRFDKCQVLINNTGILANSANISSENSLQPIKSVGYRGVSSMTPVGPIGHSIDINYTVQLDKDPNFLTVSGLKEYNSGTLTPSIIEIGGITGFGYISNYSFNVTPNNVINANVSFACYNDFSGDLKEMQYSGNIGNDQNIAHSWSTFFNSNNNYISNPILNLDYSFQANWQPIYTVLHKEARHVELISAEERVSITKGDYTKINYSGQKSEDVFSLESGDNLDLAGLNILSSNQYEIEAPDLNNITKLSLNLSGFDITSSVVNAQVENVIYNTVNMIKYY